MSSVDAGARLARRAVHVEASIRTRMLELAAGLSEVIPLGRGDPDFDAPPSVVAAGVRALEEGLTHYGAPAGVPALREAIAKKLESENGLAYEPSQVVVTNGCQEALFVAILCLVDPGDEVILQAPRFNAFDHMVGIAGGRVVSVETRMEDDFALKAASVERAITPNTKLLVVANPNNPTGALIEPEDLEELASLARERDLLVISDEIYSEILFDGRTHVSFASFPGLYERTVTVNGFSKAYAMTGLRVGYLAAPEWMLEPAVEIKHTLSICTPPALQMAALAALSNAVADRDRMAREYEARLALVRERLDRMGLRYGRPGGAMYVYADVGSTNLDAETFCLELLREQGVMIFPGTLFADSANRHVRITLLSPRAQMSEALDRMAAFVESRRPS